MNANERVGSTAETGRRCPRRMPADWQPPVPAWVADLAGIGSAVVCCIGVQSRDERSVTQIDLLRERFAQRAALSDCAWYQDAAGYRNDVLVCYFTSPAAYQRATDELSDWWDSPSRLNEAAGYWRERFTAPMSHRETLFSADDRPAGLAKLAVGMIGPVAEHGYWGGARDRIPASAQSEFSAAAQLTRAACESFGRRLRISPPTNLCVIRSGQDLTDCTGRELEDYNQRVYPALLKGMEYLRDHPAETGCYSCRFMTELDAAKPTSRTFGLAAFVSLRHLEQWAAHHPSHLAIFEAFLALAQELGPAMRLRLWHEVYVLPGGGDAFEYVNCHPDTGLLPFVASRVIA